MRLRYYIISFAVVLIIGIIGILVLFPVPENAVDIAKINDMMQSGQTIDKSAFADILSKWQIYRVQLQIGMISLLIVFTIITFFFLFTLYRKLLLPFKNMRDFAGRVAAGELDIPLQMDSKNAFGAFTESFDLMRDELRRAKENEYAAEQSKRELVASLSHDIQTPVASIKAVAELMEVTADTNEHQKLQIIQQKAGQIGTLVADLFHSTLEELHSLKVSPISFSSDQLAEIIKKSDYQDKTKIGNIPGCLVQADPARLSQVIDNIIANSYKYADTVIDVWVEMHDDELVIIFRDYGAGADPEELPLLFSKYYRGKATEGKSGYGLGLYISRTLTERMGGRLECENAEPGFSVKLWLKFDR